MLSRMAVLALVVAALACGDNVGERHLELVVTPLVGLYTDEAGGSATFTVALGDAPVDEVVVTITSYNEAEGAVSPATLTFDESNFARAQTVTITGVDDDYADGDQHYIVRASAPLYGSAEIRITNGDDDMAGVDVTPVVGLVTSEGGGPATFTVGLASRPRSEVTLPVATSDASEGTVDTAMLTFTPTSYAPQTVTVTGVQDGSADGDVAYSIVLGPAASIDTVYDQFPVDDVQVVNVDDD